MQIIQIWHHRMSSGTSFVDLIMLFDYKTFDVHICHKTRYAHRQFGAGVSLQPRNPDKCRFDWFTLFCELVILMVVVLANLSNALDQARLSAVGLLAVATVLQVLSCAQCPPQSHSLV